VGAFLCHDQGALDLAGVLREDVVVVRHRSFDARQQQEAARPDADGVVFGVRTLQHADILRGGDIAVITGLGVDQRRAHRQR